MKRLGPAFHSSGFGPGEPTKVAMSRKVLRRLGLAYLICGLLTGIVGDQQEARLLKDEGGDQSQIVRVQIEGLIRLVSFLARNRLRPGRCLSGHDPPAPKIARNAKLGHCQIKLVHRGSKQASTIVSK